MPTSHDVLTDDELQSLVEWARTRPNESASYALVLNLVAHAVEIKFGPMDGHGFWTLHRCVMWKYRHPRLTAQNLREFAEGMVDRCAQPVGEASDR